MAELKGLFKLAPAQAIKYFKNKNNALSWDWYEIWQDAHKKSFTVAKVMREDILEDIRSAVDKALSEGKTFQEFQKELKPTLQKKGWWGMREPCVKSDTALRRQRRKRTKPFDGDVGAQGKSLSTTGADLIVVDTKGNAKKVQLGSMHRLKTIYSVNMQTAYQTGRYKTQMDNVDNRPYWEYVAVMDASTRPEHAELNGLIFRYDDPFWNSFYPPNGWRCRCRVNALSDYKVKKNKSIVSSSNGALSQAMALVSKKRIAGRVRSGAETRLTPATKQEGEYKPVTVYTDPITGRTVAPDVGWSHNPAADFR